MSHQQGDVVVPNADDVLPPIIFSSSSAVIREDNGTTWLFYYGFNDTILYEKKPKNGKATNHELTINGKAVVGSRTELAATLWQGSPRVYYIDRTLVLREAVLQGNSGDKWVKGSLSNYNWKTSVNSTLAALGTRELVGESGVFLRVFFNETVSPGRFTQASNIGVDKWEKSLF